MHIMAATKSVFSGSQVLRFMDNEPARLDWDADDLDIYTTAPKGIRILAFFEKEGYVRGLLPSGQGFDRPYVDESAIACVVRLRKGEHCVVDVVFSNSGTSLLPIARFHSTLVVNIITGYEVCVAYPESTFNGKGYRRPWASNTTTSEEAVEKYKGRGYKIETFGSNGGQVTDEHIARFYCPHTTRSFADDGVFKVQFYRPMSIAAEEAYKGFMDSVTWKWGGKECACCDERNGQHIFVRRRQDI